MAFAALGSRMEYVEFVRQVMERGSLASREAAETAIQATLTTLSERIPDDDARDVAEQVPQGVGGHLTAADEHESFGYDEFVARVMEREGTTDAAAGDREAAAVHAQAVVAVLLDSVQSRTSDDLLSHLTTDYEALFGMVDPEEVWGPGWRERLGQAG